MLIKPTQSPTLKLGQVSLCQEGAEKAGLKRRNTKDLNSPKKVFKKQKAKGQGAKQGKEPGT